MEPANAVVLGGRARVELELVDTSGNVLDVIDTFLGPGEPPYHDETWRYAAVPKGRGHHWAVTVTDLDPAYTTSETCGMPNGLGFTPKTIHLSHECLRVEVYVDGRRCCNRMLYSSKPTDTFVSCFRGRSSSADKMHLFTFGVSDFRATGEASAAEVEHALDYGATIEVRIELCSSLGRTVPRDHDLRPDLSKKELPESGKTKHMKVSTEFTTVPHKSKVDYITIEDVGNLGSVKFRYRDERILQMRQAKRRRLVVEATAAAAVGPAGAAAAAVKQEEGVVASDDGDVEEIEVIDLTAETIDLTQEDV
mmetsp:Transcript_22284/g.66944  ORF Transcript_22284/g.66944 Transcript_22284/m.66944 type:complete len:308 (+) Transcript_22284:141-1064(+)